MISMVILTWLDINMTAQLKCAEMSRQAHHIYIPNVPIGWLAWALQCNSSEWWGSQASGAGGARL